MIGQIEVISKGQKNVQQGYSFRGIDDIYNSLHPIFARNKVFFTSEIINSIREDRATKGGGVLIYSIIDVKFTFFAQDGSFVTSTMRGEGMDTGDKASNKAMSAALKYALIQLFLIPTEEEKNYEKSTPEVGKKLEVQNAASAHMKDEVLQAIKKIKSAQTIAELKLTKAGFPKHILANDLVISAGREQQVVVTPKQQPANA